MCTIYSLYTVVPVKKIVSWKNFRHFAWNEKILMTKFSQSTIIWMFHVSFSYNELTCIKLLGSWSDTVSYIARMTHANYANTRTLRIAIFFHAVLTTMLQFFSTDTPSRKKIVWISLHSRFPKSKALLPALQCCTLKSLLFTSFSVCTAAELRIGLAVRL